MDLALELWLIKNQEPISRLISGLVKNQAAFFLVLLKHFKIKKSNCKCIMIVMETGYVEQHRSDPGRSDRLRFASRSEAVFIDNLSDTYFQAAEIVN